MLLCGELFQALQYLLRWVSLPVSSPGHTVLDLLSHGMYFLICILRHYLFPLSSNWNTRRSSYAIPREGILKTVRVLLLTGSQLTGWTTLERFLLKQNGLYCILTEINLSLLLFPSHLAISHSHPCSPPILSYQGPRGLEGTPGERGPPGEGFPGPKVTKASEPVEKLLCLTRSWIINR